MGEEYSPIFFILMRAFCLLVALQLASCKAPKSNEIEFGFGHKFTMVRGERLGSLDKKVIAEYEKYINHFPDVQLPLTRMIESSRYKIFIGVCLNKNFKDLGHILESDTNSLIIRHSGMNYLSVQDNYFIFKNLKDNGKYSPYCISVLSQDSTFIDSTYHFRNSLMKRFSFYE